MVKALGGGYGSDRCAIRSGQVGMLIVESIGWIGLGQALAVFGLVPA
jgi:hypothetical protein